MHKLVKYLWENIINEFLKQSWSISEPKKVGKGHLKGYLRLPPLSDMHKMISVTMI